MEFISLGGTRLIRTADISAVFDISSLASKTYINKLKEDGMMIDISGSKEARTVIVTRCGYVLFTSLNVDTVKNKLASMEGEDEL